MRSITLALDWTPNVNHIGFLVAQHKDIYQDYGLNVKIVDPSEDNYALTPVKKVELGRAGIALCPTESILSYRTKVKPFDLVGIGAIFQHDVSAIVVKTGKGIKSPKDLDGKCYASYKAMYEDSIVRQMIRNDGGEGNIEIAYPEKLGIWETVLGDAFDATWIFENWEGVQASTMSESITTFRMEDYGIPYSYSPMIVASGSRVKSDEESYQKFMQASKAGFMFCKDHPDEAVAILKELAPEKDRNMDLHKALDISMKAFGNEDQWGKIDEKVIDDFLDWIYEHDLETKKLEAQDLIFTGLLGMDSR